MRHMESWKKAIFVGPGLLVYVLFMIVPIAMSLFYSVTNWNGFSPEYKIIGLDNFRRLWDDTSFRQALKATLIITFACTFVYNTIGLFLAVLLDRVGRAYQFAKSAIFIPTILSGVVVSFMWSYITQGDGGVANYLLAKIGLGPVYFYDSWSSSVYTASGVISWAGLGFYMTVYLAALQTIPREVLEASEMDGAGGPRKFWYVTLPMLTPGITICTLLSIIWGLKQYDFVKVLVPGTVQTISVNAVERAFEYNLLSYASAIAVVLFIMTFAFSLVQIRIMKGREVEH